MAGASVALVSLLTAWAGIHDGALALALGLVLTAVATLVVARRPTVRPGAWSWPPAIALALILVLAASQFLPGFPLAAKNRDPGVYVNHAVAIADQGDTRLTDPVAETGAELVVEDGRASIVTADGQVAWRKLPYRSFPTDADDAAHILPDFFHLWPATLATAYDLAGTTGLFNLTPLFALLAVGLLFLAVRRAFGLVAASVAAGLLSVNEMVVWQAKFPTAESLSLFLYAGALLAVVLALTTRARVVAAAIAGGLVGLGFVARPDGIFVVGLAAVALAALWAFDRMDGRGWAFAAGLAPTLLIGTYQAYGQGSRYARLQDGLPSFREAVVGAILLVVLAAAVRWQHRRMPVDRTRAAERRRWVALAFLGLVALFALFLVVAFFRDELLGANYRIDKRGDRTRGYDELNLKRLILFLTPVSFLAAIGVLVVGVRDRWSAARWVLVLPGLIVAPVLIWEPRIAPDLMWWTRRYVPMVVPTFLILLGAAAAWFWDRRGDRQRLWRVLTVGLVVLVGGYMLRQSSDLWGHEEFGGSHAVIEALAEVGDDDAVFVWQGQSPMAPNFAVSPFTWTGRPALSGSPNPTAQELLAVQDALGGRPLYLVADGAEPPPGAADVLVEERRIVGELDEFEHGLANRPRRSRPVPVDLTVWRLEPPS